jgi:uncharacterized protein
MSLQEVQKIPYLGCGIGLRSDISDETFAHHKEIETVEIISERFFSDRIVHNREYLEKAKKYFSVIPHGVKLSIGSASPISKQFLHDMKWLTEHVGAHYYSDHYSLTHDDDMLDIGHLSPLWFTKEMLEHVCARVNQIQQFLGKPLVLENITAPFTIPEADYEEPEFISRVCEKTGCGLLLDVTNVFINAYNQKKDALSLVQQYPLRHLVQVHLAGGEIHEGVFVDTHSQAVSGDNEGVWPLLEYVAQNGNIRALIIERDENFGEEFEDLVMKDLRRAKSIVEASRHPEKSLS